MEVIVYIYIHVCVCVCVRVYIRHGQQIEFAKRRMALPTGQMRERTQSADAHKRRTSAEEQKGDGSLEEKNKQKSQRKSQAKNVGRDSVVTMVMVLFCFSFCSFAPFT